VGKIVSDKITTQNQNDSSHHVFGTLWAYNRSKGSCH